MTDRFEQLEGEVRELRHAMVLLVQLQERQQHLLERFGEMRATQEDHSKRLQTIEKSQPGMLEFKRWAVAIFAAILGAIGSSYWATQIVNPPAVVQQPSSTQRDNSRGSPTK